MVFFDLGALREQWKRGLFTEWDAVTYFLADAFVIGVCESATEVAGSARTAGKTTVVPNILSEIISRGLGLVLAMVILYFIVRALYRANGGDRGRRFIEKAMSLNFVIGMRLIPIAISVLILGKSILSLAVSSFSKMELLAFLGVYLFAVFAMCYYGYWMLRESLKEIYEFEDKQSRLGVTSI